MIHISILISGTSFAPSAPPMLFEAKKQYTLAEKMADAVPTLSQDTQMGFENRNDFFTMAQENESINDGALTVLVYPKGGELYVFKVDGLSNWRGHLTRDGYRWKGVRIHKYVNDNGEKLDYYVFDQNKSVNSDFKKFIWWDKKADLVYIHYIGNHQLAGKYPHGNEVLQKRTYIRSSGIVKDKVLAAQRKMPSQIYHEASSKGSGGMAGIIPNPRNERQVR